MFQAKPVSCTDKVSSNNCRYSCANWSFVQEIQALKFWLQDCSCTTIGKAQPTGRVWLYLWSCLETLIWSCTMLSLATKPALTGSNPSPPCLHSSALSFAKWFFGSRYRQTATKHCNSKPQTLGEESLFLVFWDFRSTSLQESWTSAIPPVIMC